MCKALEDLYAEGKAEGMANEIHIIRLKLRKNVPMQAIVDWMELDEAYVKQIADLDQKFRGYQMQE